MKKKHLISIIFASKKWVNSIEIKKTEKYRKNPKLVNWSV